MWKHSRKCLQQHHKAPSCWCIQLSSGQGRCSRQPRQQAMQCASHDTTTWVKAWVIRNHALNPCAAQILYYQCGHGAGVGGGEARAKAAEGQKGLLCQFIGPCLFAIAHIWTCSVAFSIKEAETKFKDPKIQSLEIENISRKVLRDTQSIEVYFGKTYLLCYTIHLAFLTLQSYPP